MWREIADNDQQLQQIFPWNGEWPVFIIGANRITMIRTREICALSTKNERAQRWTKDLTAFEKRTAAHIEEMVRRPRGPANEGYVVHVSRCCGPRVDETGPRECVRG